MYDNSQFNPPTPIYSNFNKYITNIPESLKSIDHWVAFTYLPNTKGSKPRKIPLNPNAVNSKKEAYAKTNDPNTWSSFETVCEYIKRHPGFGIGFVLTEDIGIVGVDIDNCVDPETGELNSIAKDIISMNNTYAEYSPSGEGIHLWYLGEKTLKGSKNSLYGVEVYNNARYLTVTGNKLDDTSAELNEGTETIHEIQKNYINKNNNSDSETDTIVRCKMSDDDIIKKASEAKNGEKFKDLYNGNWDKYYSSQSEADCALCCILAFWTGKDPAKINSVFRSSKLYRDKWNDPHFSDGTTYGDATIKNAIGATKETYHYNKSPICISNGAYYFQKGEKYVPITNFIIKPGELVVSDKEMYLNAEFINTENRSQTILLLSNDFDSKAKFKSAINKKSFDYSFIGTDTALEHLKSYISSDPKWERKTGISIIGTHFHDKKLVFVDNEHAYSSDDTVINDIIPLSQKIDAETSIMHNNSIDKDGMYILGKLIMNYNIPIKTIPILAWMAACFIKTQLKSIGIKFPHLFLTGEAGSGKSTTLENVLIPFFSVETPPLAASQATKFASVKILSETNTIPVFIDEYKPSKMDISSVKNLDNIFRQVYDGQNATRGKKDLTVAKYELIAPICIAGEESANETAIRERSIEVLFSKKDIKNKEYKACLQNLINNRSLIKSFGKALLNTALKTNVEEIKEWHSEGLRSLSDPLPERISNSYAVCYCGLKLIEKLCNILSLNWDDIFGLFSIEICSENIKNSIIKYLLDGQNNNISIIENTFAIMSRMELTDTDYFINLKDNTLHIYLAGIYDRFTEYIRTKNIKAEYLEYSQFKKQLENSDLFVESNKADKINGKTKKMWVVDYALLKSRCDVSGFTIERGTPPLTQETAQELLSQNEE